MIYEGEITVGADFEWEPSGEPGIWRAHTTDETAIDQDARRMFLAQSLRLDAVMRFAGWRERIVALIPDEVGPKESKIWRTTATGTVDGTHTYNVLDAIGTYAGYVHDLAMEFGTTGKAAAAQSDWPKEAQREIREGGLVPNIVQAWLLREAAEAQLDQARHTLKFSLGAQARLQHMGGSIRPMAMAELARSLYTDRANLTRVVKAAESDERIRQVLDYAASAGRSVLASSQD